MQKSVPIHYALLSSSLALAIGVLIGTQFSGPAASSKRSVHTSISHSTVSNSENTQLAKDMFGGNIESNAMTQAYDANRNTVFSSTQQQESLGDSYLELTGEPASLLANAFEQKQGIELQEQVLSVIDVWAMKDSKAAFDWLEANANHIGPVLPDLYSTIMSHHIRRSPESSKWLIDEMNAGELKSSLAAELAIALADTEPLNAVQWSSSLQDNNARARAVEAAMQRFAEVDPDSALQHVMSVSDTDLQTKLLHEVGFVMASADPVKASNSLSLFPIETQTNLIPRIAWSMSRKNPQQATNWVNQLPVGETRDQAIREASWGLVAANPRQAFELVSTVADPTLRYGLVRDAMIAWHKMEPSNTQQALQSHTGLTQEQKRFLLEDLKRNAHVPDMVAPN